MQDELVVRRAAADLRPHLRRLWGYSQVTGRPVQLREPISTGTVLIFGLETELDIVAADGTSRRVRSFGAGLAEECAVIRHDGRMRGVQVDLSPVAARRVFGVPMHELRDEAVDVETLLGRDGTVLEAQLVEAASWEARFALVEAALRRRLASVEPSPPDVEWAWRLVGESRGRLRVDAIAERLGCSRKHLAARFREHVGVSPKVALRIHRFRHALERLEADARSSIAEIAAGCGYFDEAHLDRDFRAFAGTTPSAYRADPRAVTFVQDD